MRRVIFPVIMLFSAFLTVMMDAQTPDPILQFLGSDAVEEMNTYDVERLETLLEHPLPLNYVSESRLGESGLMTRYQIVSLMDYRRRHGDILSFSELAAVDGFGQAFVSKIAPFVSLESRRLPGSSSIPSMKNDFAARASFREGAAPTYGLKYRMDAGESLSGGLSVSRTSGAGDTGPDAFSGYLAIHFKRRPGKLVAGDFNARFGQGLALWNGMSFSGLTSASSFMRSHSGISSSSSFTGGYALRGLAGDIRVGRLRISALTAASKTGEGHSLMPGANLSLMFRNGQISMTHYADFSISETALRIPDMKTSADFAFCIRGTDLFGEVSYDWVSASTAAVGGASVKAGEDLRAAAMLRYYPASYNARWSAAARSTTECSNEYAASLALDFAAGEWVDINGASGFGSSARRHSGKASADFAYFPVAKDDSGTGSLQLKAQTEWAVMISESFRITARLTERLRTWGDPFRTDLRADFSYMSRYVFVNMRLNAVRCMGMGLLAYAEGGLRNENFSLWLRQGIFRIDNWADRIYVYERDAPSSFNVPAYYGRGLWTALTMNWKYSAWGRIYIRAAALSYPFMAEKKPGRAELKFHFVFIF